MSDRLAFGLLGPLSVTLQGAPVKLGGPKERLVLATLLLSSGRVVSSDRLIQVLWGDDPPNRASGTLQVHVSNLRRRLAGGLPTVITQPPGYLLLASAAELDLLRFEELVALSRERMGNHELSHARDLLKEALELWRGPALADLESVEFVDSSRTFLSERRLAVEEDLVNLTLALGEPREALQRLSRCLEENPLRETLWEHRMLALYRLGRQGEALSAFRQCREMLMDELGIEPTPRLRALERSILRQDPELDLARSLDSAASLSAPDVTATFVADARSSGLLVRPDGSAVELETVVVLGRHPDCDVVLPDPAVSRQHAEIRPALGGHLLSDLASSNGTLVGEEPVMHRLLEDGDLIRVGSHTLRYVRR